MSSFNSNGLFTEGTREVGGDRGIKKRKRDKKKDVRSALKKTNGHLANRRSVCVTRKFEGMCGRHRGP